MNKVVFNFSKNLYSLKKLPFEQTVSLYHIITLDFKSLLKLMIFSSLKTSFEIEHQGSIFMWEIKPINQVIVDPIKYDDQVSINVLDLIFTQTFNYS